jgi:deoxyadenosine/deoxycytidine kinase
MKLVLDGNIGCGKSSVINKIIETNCIDLPIYNEPLNDWDQWLKLFYSDMTKYSFGFQMRVLKSHLDKKDVLNGFFERSPLSCQRVFGELLFEDKQMTQLEWNLTEEFNNDFGWTPDIVIYLKCSPKVCYERIHKRNRYSEETISLEYLERLNAKYEKLYTNNSNVRVIQIDATQSIDKVFEEIMEKVIRKIRFSIHRTNDFSFRSI